MSPSASQPWLWVMLTCASARSSTVDTTIGRSSPNTLIEAPSPSPPHQRRPSAGADTTPMTAPRSMCVSAIKVAQIGMPRTNPDVPSIGSITHRHGEPWSPASPCSSPKAPWPGRSRTRCSTIIVSARRSISVTSVWFRFQSIVKSASWKCGSVNASTRSTTSSASARSCERSSSSISLTTRLPVRRPTHGSPVVASPATPPDPRRRRVRGSSASRRPAMPRSSATPGVASD